MFDDTILEHVFEDSGARADAGREQQLADLRARMAQITGRVGAVSRAAVQSADVVAVSGGIGDLLPDGGLARGTVVACQGSTNVLLGLLAGVTAAGQDAAVIGVGRLGLLAAVEMGADLERLAIIDPSGGDPLEVAHVLADGAAVVVLDPGSRRVVVPATRARGLVQRVRSQGTVLIYTEKVSGFRADLMIRARVTAWTGLGPGVGRLRQMKFAVEISDRSMRTRRTELLLAGRESADHMAWTRVSAAKAEAAQRWSRTG